MTVYKKCKVHGDLTTLAQLKCGVYKGKKYKKCRQCENERVKKFAEKNRDKLRAKDRKYWSEKKEEITKRRQAPDKLAKRREWGKENKEKYAPYYREKQLKYKMTLADPYIKKRIQNGNKDILWDQITPGMVELQRAIFKAKGAIKIKQLKEKTKKNDETIKRGAAKRLRTGVTRKARKK
jgi:hypothetical protein